ncbi:class I SAM-dependent methyltransferase [Allorhizocola rhizosphaerae]|uniref:class I SAM-dependent methyltransferase n=1 Tax=Allorhizocola rhizosphaerae TaxID=1872709 RepID=UPI000E3BDD78|nr:class I SAM-dependent methyltransferase [Allorhizocola rhizosphaerae]
MPSCRICGGVVSELLDLGRQPSANRFLARADIAREFMFRLAIGMCHSCTMVQLIEDVPEEIRYHDGYRYRASGSATHRRHFARVARELLATELAGPNPFIVEIGCNDGVMLETIARAGVRHLGVDPAKEVTELARERGVNVLDAFFGDSVAEGIRAEHGSADVIFGANTVCHIAYQDSLLRGVDTLLGPDGVFVFEEPYLGTVISQMAFDQIYDEHVYYFTARSVQQMAQRYGFELVDVGRSPLHGGEIRYTLTRPGRRRPSPAVGELLADERHRGLADPVTFQRFADAVAKIRDDLLTLLRDLRDRGSTVVGYGAPGKTATVTNYCGIGPELVPFVVDSTPAKQGLLVPGSHLPVRPPQAFTTANPDYALLFAWNHADEIMAKEQAFSRRGKWIRYVPDVRVG